MSRKPDVHVPTLPLPLEKAEEVRMLLEQVLGNRLFRSSRRCQILLRYITEQTLAGETSSLKERTLGIDVFGRTPDYDTSQDPIVRASAAEIRKKLAQYYQEPGHESETRIELLSGSYIAEFHFIGSGNGSSAAGAASVAGVAGVAGGASVAGAAGVVAPSQPLLPASKPGVVGPSQPLLPTSEPDAPAPSRMRYAAIAGGAAAAVALLIMAFTLALPGWRRQRDRK